MLSSGQVVVATSEHNGQPNQIIQHLKTNPCQGNLFHHYNLGGYLIWQLPETKVYVDGRMGTTWTRPADTNLGEPGENYFNTWSLIYSGEKSFELSQVLFGIGKDDPYDYTDKAKQNQVEVFNQFNITCAIVGPDSKIYQQLQDAGWQTVVPDDNGWLLLTKAL
jgi:hypothetical protein